MEVLSGAAGDGGHSFEQKQLVEDAAVVQNVHAEPQLEHTQVHDASQQDQAPDHCLQDRDLS